MMIIGGVAVLGALLFLFHAISSESPAATVTATPGERPAAPTAAPSAPTTPSFGTPAARPTPLKPRVESSGERGGGGGSPPPALSEEDAPPATRLNTKNMNWGAPQIRELIAANEPHVKECIRTSGGGRESGEAVTTYIVAQRGDKVVIEETSADSDKTTLKNEALVECLHKTAMHMKFVGLPRQADAIIVTRSITLADGALADDKMVKFNYIR